MPFDNRSNIPDDDTFVPAGSLDVYGQPVPLEANLKQTKGYRPTKEDIYGTSSANKIKKSFRKLKKTVQNEYSHLSDSSNSSSGEDIDNSYYSLNGNAVSSTESLILNEISKDSKNHKSVTVVSTSKYPNGVSGSKKTNRSRSFNEKDAHNPGYPTNLFTYFPNPSMNSLANPNDTPVRKPSIIPIQPNPVFVNKEDHATHIRFSSHGTYCNKPSNPAETHSTGSIRPQISYDNLKNPKSKSSYSVKAPRSSTPGPVSAIHHHSSTSNLKHQKAVAFDDDHSYISANILKPRSLKAIPVAGTLPSTWPSNATHSQDPDFNLGEMISKIFQTSNESPEKKMVFYVLGIVGIFWGYNIIFSFLRLWLQAFTPFAVVVIIAAAVVGPMMFNNAPNNKTKPQLNN